MKLVAHKRAYYGQIGSRRPLWISTGKRAWDDASDAVRNSGAMQTSRYGAISKWNTSSFVPTDSYSFMAASSTLSAWT